MSKNLLFPVAAILKQLTYPRHATRKRGLLLAAVSLALIFSLASSAALGAPAGQGTVSPSSLGTFTWFKEVADQRDTFSAMTDRSLAIDSDGNPHIAVGGNHLYYASLKNSVWTMTQIDGAWSVGKYAALALDSDDHAHISYYDASNQDLKYAYYDGDNWHVETVDSLGDVGQYTSIVLPSDSRPQISYYDATNGNLKVASYTGSQWVLETVDGTSSDVGMYSSMALDSDGDPHISYYDATNTALKYVFWNGDYWKIETVDSTENSGVYTSIAVDNDDDIHVSYARVEDDGSDSELRYGLRSGSTWDTESVDTVGRVGAFNSIAVSSTDIPHISYYDDSDDDLMYAYWTGTEWSKAVIDSKALKLAAAPELSEGILAATGFYTSIALKSDSPRISYYDFTNNLVKYASKGTSGWTLQDVNTTGPLGEYTSIALDNEYRPHISYYDEGLQELRYASPVEGVWVVQTVDSDGNVGKFSSLALRSDGYPRISYYDDTDKILKYAAWDGSKWVIQTVDDGGDDGDDVGQYSSLVLSSTDTPHISYYDATNQDLKHAYWNGSDWVKERVDPGGEVGQYTSIALDSAGNPHISYFEDHNNNLRHAYKTSSGWVIEVVVSDNNVGSYSDIAVDQWDNIHISYYDTTNAQPWYARRLSGSTAWEIFPVDVPGSDGLYTSIATTGTEYEVHVVYFNDDKDDLKHASFDIASKTFTTEIVDGPDSVGKYASLAATPDGALHVSYYDATLNALKYAVGFTVNDQLFLPLVPRVAP